MVLFGYSTVLSWIYYGEKSVAYLFGDRWINGYRAVYVLFLGVGAVVELDLVWMLSDIFNGFMAIPNLVALILLNKAVVRESDDYTQNIYNLERFNVSQAPRSPIGRPCQRVRLRLRRQGRH
jgi:AGCS family alanine or glycine:cation symporter